MNRETVGKEKIRKQTQKMRNLNHDLLQEEMHGIAMKCKAIEVLF